MVVFFVFSAFFAFVGFAFAFSVAAPRVPSMEDWIRMFMWWVSFCTSLLSFLQKSACCFGTVDILTFSASW